MISLRTSRHAALLLAALGSVLLAACGSDQKGSDKDTSAAPASSRPEPELITPTRPVRNPLMDAYFGELHLHTAYSLDAYIFGNTMNDPFTAYRFAKGEEVALPTGIAKRIRKPLDFAAVTDHSEALGEYEICTNPAQDNYDSDTCVGIRNFKMQTFQQLFSGMAVTPPARLADICGEGGSECLNAIAPPWQRIQQAANENYQPGKFTSFVAYEFSANAPEGQGGMMHRNVIFRSDSVPDTVFSAFEGTGEDLQVWLEQNCTDDCQVLTIPHNPNFYWGRLYWGKNSDGSEWTDEQVERRTRYDRLVEIMQIKGNSECQTGIMTTDEECNFETVFQPCPEGENAGCSNEYAMVRNGLKLGLQQQAENGINPFKQGFAGGTDNHNGTPSDTAENDFEGHYANNDGTPEVRLGLKANPTAEAMGMSGDDDPTRLYNPGAITGVWAESNTREDIWDALYRKETFATSGTRIKVRMFAGFELPDDLYQQENWVSTAYASGVPQGGDLGSATEGQAPNLVVWAQRDPDSAPLAKMQIIKGWRSADNELHEMTYDVACSGGASPDPATHRCPDNGATVDLNDCTISTDKGASELAATWQDPQFNAGEHAFYYARVLENPVCRWSMYDAKKAGVEHPADLPKTIRERAWSSPIWYTPN
ncbi:DUF3604 domain-containing protein [Pseudomaricurvus sp. HS19]|uniref:DUF3604 domain-containing protein n=1 Tax=Pseudomaricurvus sp. HS19 TaxID=2692626 RepID=UPI00136EB493|nr:DUF3604 domain-containing protein [Pseudomaricurvus sp. HS19]MYM62935.1 DUF3604 domain-containing protein [Pseudomaricurvus sp. HS19]